MPPPRDCPLLAWYETVIGMLIGVLRPLVCQIKGTFKDPYSEESDGGLWQDIQSACAEIAVAKLLNLYPNNTVGIGKQIADVGGRIEVRHSQDGGRLIVRENDPPERIYVLVYGRMPKYKAIGWIEGKDARQKDYWQNPNGKGWAWWVPARKLEPMQDLIDKRYGRLSKLHVNGGLPPIPPGSIADPSIGVNDGH